MTDVDAALEFLFGLSWQDAISLFWYTLIFELPRYSLAFPAAALAKLKPRERLAARPQATAPAPKISVVVAGHNESDKLERCVRSLREQSLQGLEIVIVSDGSTDDTASIASRLVRLGLADRALATDLRCGKSAGVNLAIRFTTGDIIVNVDCDCSYDRFAIERAVEKFDDPRVGIVCGDVVPRNGDASLAARFQEIEYLLTISVGKRVAASIEQVVCASGAFTAIRRAALESVGGVDVGGGEDLDLTLRMRSKGWRVAFAEDAVCFTDVPVALWTLVRQRLRWERDAIWIRYRKHRRLMNPRVSGFRLSEAFHQWDFIAYDIVAAAVFPIYICSIFACYGAWAIPVLIAMQFGLFTLDAAMLALAEVIVGRSAFRRNIGYLFGYSLFASYFMRMVRVAAYVEEWFLSGSRKDNYVPLKVRAVRAW